MRRIIIATLAAVLLAANAGAVVPNAITVQGKLTDPGGTPLSPGAKNFTFKIFNAAVGGTEIWPAGPGEDQSISTGTDGLWIGLVGAMLPLTDAVFQDTLRWLEITVDGDVLPRVRLVTGPYAYRVATVDGASGGTITSKVSIGPGHTNSGDDAFVAGANNTALGQFNVVLGRSNWVNDDGSVVGGGGENSANAIYATVSGGRRNLVEGAYATVGGGNSNEATGAHTTVGGGTANIANSDYASIGGGGNNRARGSYATVCGGGGPSAGDSNAAIGEYASIGGGSENLAAGWSSTVAGGFVNYAHSEAATIGGGVANDVSGISAVISGGNSNVASGAYSSVAGGLYNSAADTGAAVGGGANNKCHGLYSTIAGGGGTDPSDSNSITSWWSTIGGGARNISNGGVFATIGGGVENRAHYFAVVGGGGHNTAIGGAAFIGGGEFSNASGTHSVVGGGYYNNATGESATIPGGTSNAARGDYSLAAGFYARANHEGSFVWSDHSFQFPIYDSAYSTAPNQFIIRAAGGVGIGTYSPSTATGGQVLHVDNPFGPSVLRLGDGAPNGIQWEVQSTVIGATGALNFSNITAFTNPMQLYNNGDLILTGSICAANHACPSDARLKADIHPLNNALESVERLCGVGYRWNDEARMVRGLPDDEQIGLLAQEVQKVVPTAVQEMGDGYLAVDYARLVPLLIEAVKEQQKQIESMRQELAKALGNRPW